MRNITFLEDSGFHLILAGKLTGCIPENQTFLKKTILPSFAFHFDSKTK